MNNYLFSHMALSAEHGVYSNVLVVRLKLQRSEVKSKNIMKNKFSQIYMQVSLFDGLGKNQILGYLKHDI